VKKYFDRLRESAVLAGKKMTKKEFNEYISKKEEEEGNTDPIMIEEDEEEESDNIPDSFYELTDSNFPLFITYDEFSKMLQGTYRIKKKSPLLTRIL